MQCLNSGLYTFLACTLTTESYLHLELLFYIYLYLLGFTPGSAHNLFLAQFPGITSLMAQRTIPSARDETQVSCMQPYLLYYLS